MMEAVMGAILKFGATLFGHLVFTIFQGSAKNSGCGTGSCVFDPAVMCGSPQAGQFL